MVSRFLSPDPYIQAPGFTQSYNRYGYVWNNPLSYIDPSGYTSVDIWGRQKFDRWGTYILPQDRTGGYSGAPGSGYWPGAYGNSSATGQGNWVNNFAVGVRPPGYGKNGSGFGGIYYDWYSGTYQSTNGRGQLHWRDAYDVLIAHKLNPGGQTLPPINVIWSGRYGSGRIIGGVPKWWGFFRQSRGIVDYAALGIGAVGTYYGFMGDAFYSSYHHMQHNGTIRSARFVRNNLNKIYQTSRDSVKALTKNARYLREEQVFLVVPFL